MKFKQYEDGSCDIEFSFKERLILFRKGKLHLSDNNLKHFSNHLMHILMEFQTRLKKDVATQQTFVDTEIKTK